MNLLNQCTVCKNRNTKSCSFCNNVYYCSKEHQKQDWKNHKNNCAPFKICFNESLGRHLVASRNIKEGEVIINKKPLVVGPKLASLPLCLGCHKILQSQNSIFYQCKQCKWPLCNELCESSANHLLECEVFSKNKYAPLISNKAIKQSVYSLVTPLRAILLKTSNPEKFKSLMSMQSHLEQHVDTPMYKILQTSLVPLIKRIHKDTSTEEILMVCSIFDTNCFEIRDTEGLIRIRGLYPMASLMSHDCTTNTEHLYQGDDHQMKVFATVDIKKGEILKTTYTQTLWNTLTRRLHLRTTKKFDCICNRCADPTEFGTYAGSIICSQCNDGRSKLVSVNPLCNESFWKCEECRNGMSWALMQEMNENLRKQIQVIDKRKPKEFEDFLENYKTTLHSTNWHVLEVKYALIQLYGNIPGYYLSNLSNSLLNRKFELCNEMLKVADILVPGCSRFRGTILRELHETIVSKAKRDFQENTIDTASFKNKIVYALELLELSLKMLRPERKAEDTILKSRLEYLKLLGDN